MATSGAVAVMCIFISTFMYLTTAQIIFPRKKNMEMNLQKGILNAQLGALVREKEGS